MRRRRRAVSGSRAARVGRLRPRGSGSPPAARRTHVSSSGAALTPCGGSLLMRLKSRIRRALALVDIRAGARRAAAARARAAAGGARRARRRGLTGARVSPASSRNAGAPAAARGTCVSSGEQRLGRRRAVGAAAARSGERIVSLGALSQTKARATRPLPPALPPRALPRAPRALGSNAPPRAGGRRPPDRPPARPARGRPQAPPAPAAGGSSTASSACTSTRPSRWM